MNYNMTLGLKPMCIETKYTLSHVVVDKIYNMRNHDDRVRFEQVNYILGDNLKIKSNLVMYYDILYVDDAQSILSQDIPAGKKLHFSHDALSVLRNINGKQILTTINSFVLFNELHDLHDMEFNVFYNSIYKLQHVDNMCVDCSLFNNEQIELIINECMLFVNQYLDIAIQLPAYKGKILNKIFSSIQTIESIFSKAITKTHINAIQSIYKNYDTSDVIIKDWWGVFIQFIITGEFYTNDDLINSIIESDKIEEHFPMYIFKIGVDETKVMFYNLISINDNIKKNIYQWIAEQPDTQEYVSAINDYELESYLLQQNKLSITI